MTRWLRNDGAWIIIFLLVLALGASFELSRHRPVTPPTVVVPYCDGKDGLFYPCTDPWVPREYTL